MLIKICGLRDNFSDVAALNPDFAGLIFYPKSPRFVESIHDERLKPKLAGVKKVGVFVNADTNYILCKVSEYHLDLVQLHVMKVPISVPKFVGLFPLSKLLAFRRNLICKLLTNIHNMLIICFLIPRPKVTAVRGLNSTGRFCIMPASSRNSCSAAAFRWMI